MLKRFFSKPAVSRVEEKSFFFLVLYLGIMRLEGAETLVTQNYNISSSWRELCWKRKNLEKFRRWNFWILKIIVTQNSWTARKKLFRREKQNLQEIKIQITKSQISSKKRSKNWKSWQKILSIVYLNFFF